MKRGIRATLIVAIASFVIVYAAVPARADIGDKRNDYNGDGISDVVAVWNGDDCLYRLNGLPGGGFAPMDKVSCGWGSVKASLSAPGDLDRDGIGDLVAIDADSGCMYVYKGTGTGGFFGATQQNCGWELFARGLHGAGDINGDGVGDLISIRDDNGCLVKVLGNGTGGFQARERISCTYTQWQDTMTGVGDNTGDGRADLTGISVGDPSDPCLWSFQFTTSGGVGASSQVECGWGPYVQTRNIAGMGDLNGDGQGDLVGIDTTNGRLRYWYGDGDGGFGRTHTYGGGFGDFGLAS